MVVVFVVAVEAGGVEVRVQQSRDVAQPPCTSPYHDVPFQTASVPPIMAHVFINGSGSHFSRQNCPVLEGRTMTSPPPIEGFG